VKSKTCSGVSRQNRNERQNLRNIRNRVELPLQAAQSSCRRRGTVVFVWCTSPRNQRHAQVEQQTTTVVKRAHYVGRNLNSRLKRASPTHPNLTAIGFQYTITNTTGAPSRPRRCAACQWQLNAIRIPEVWPLIFVLFGNPLQFSISPLIRAVVCCRTHRAPPARLGITRESGRTPSERPARRRLN